MRPIDFVFLAVIIAGYLFYWRLKNGSNRKKKGGSFASPDLNRNEKAALKALQEEGYTLQQAHPVISVAMNVDDDKKKEFNHKINFIASRGGRSYLVKVVKGDNTSPLSSAALRKDLLMDQLFFLPAGILVYNVDNNRIQKISFSFDGYSIMEKKITRAALIILIMIGVAILGWYIYEGVLSL